MMWVGSLAGDLPATNPPTAVPPPGSLFLIGYGYNHPRRINNFSISTATNTTDDTARQKASSSKVGGSILAGEFVSGVPAL